MWQSDRNGVLEGAALKGYYSPYIMEGGAAKDRIAIDRIEINGRSCKATCSMKEYYTSPTDTVGFHLSVQRSVDFLTQIACIHALYLNGRETKDVEIWMPDFQITLTKPQRDPNNIQISMDLFARSSAQSKGASKNELSFYKWKFDIGDGGWWGVVTYCLPV